MNKKREKSSEKWSKREQKCVKMRERYGDFIIKKRQECGLGWGEGAGVFFKWTDEQGCATFDKVEGIHQPK